MISHVLLDRHKVSLSESAGSDCFPVEYSTLSCDALTQRVLAQYAIAPVVSCRLWNRGLSDIYLVETRDQPYILRVSHAHWRSQGEVEFELAFLDCLRQHGVPVAYPLLTQAGDLCIEIAAPEGKRYAALFVFALGDVPLCDLNQIQAAALGAKVAEVHTLASRFRPPCHRPPLVLDHLLDESLTTILPFFAQQPKEQQYLQDLRSQLQARLAHLPQESPYWVVCWGDPHSGNVHFTPEGNLTLFDFDQCGYGWRTFDIAKFLQTSLRTGLNFVARQAFLEGYESVVSLEEWELSSLADLVQVAHIWGWAIRLKAAQLHSYSQLDDRYFTQRLHQLKSFRQQNWQLF